MTDLVCKELKLEKYQALVRIALGQDCPLALCDRGGSPLRTSDTTNCAGLEAVLTAERLDGVDPNAANGEQLRCDLDADRTLFYQRVQLAEEDGMWLALLVEGSRHASAASVVGVLKSLAECVADEYRLNQELNGLARELSQRYEELNLVYSLGEVAHVERSVEARLRPLLEKVASYIGADAAALILADQTAPIVARNTEKAIPNLDLILTDMHGGLFRFVSIKNKPLVMNQKDEERRRYLFPDLPYKLLACPVSDGRSVRAMLTLLRHDDGPDFSNGDRKLSSVIADHTGSLMRNQAALDKMRQFGEQMGAALIEAVEAKSPRMRGHAERVQSIAMYIGYNLGLERSDLEDLFWGSLMHDIGKICVPDIILFKQARLTEDEYAFFKMHPERGYEILRHVEFVGDKVLECVRHHHERFDGKGYQMAQRGQEIPVHALIIAVADAYEAMRSPRAHQSPLGHEAALAELRRVAGTQLDPELVTAFEEACQSGMTWLDQLEFCDSSSHE